MAAVSALIGLVHVRHRTIMALVIGRGDTDDDQGGPMTLRTRLALVLVALVVAPLVAAGVLVLYAVPRAAAERADSLVTGAGSAITDELTQECDRVATATVVTGRSLGTSSPKRATTDAVDDGLDVARSIHHQQHHGFRDHADRHEIPDRVIGQALVESGGDGVRRAVREDRVAVRRGLRHARGADGAACSCAVFHDDRLAQLQCKLLEHDSVNDIR